MDGAELVTLSKRQAEELWTVDAAEEREI